MGHNAHSYRWGHSALTLDFDLSPTAPRLLRVTRPGEPELPYSGLPLADVTLLGDGTGWSGPHFTGTALAGRLRYRAHQAAYGAGRHYLTVELTDPEEKLAVFAEYSSPEGIPVLRSRVRVRNTGGDAVALRHVGSLLLGGLPSPDVLDVHSARNDWLAECRWGAAPLREAVPDIGREFHGHDARAAFRLSSAGSWPTDGYLAMGALSERGGGDGGVGDVGEVAGGGGAGRGGALVWQIESGAGWSWQAAEADGRTWIGLGGPSYDAHGWRQVLAPGEEFASEYAAVGFGDDFEDAVRVLTSYRRHIRRPHPDHERLPIVFNDYMNTLMGDPTTEKLLPLIDAAASVGAEYFCVDAGWYDEENGGWWDSVGAWEAATSRFPGGLGEVLARIRERGMVAGLWLEPEVVGVRSPVAGALPEEAFLRHEDRTRITEQGRHQLDLTHPAARAHLDAAVDRIVGEWGVGYLKLDYNITTTSPNLLAHSRAWREWVGGLLDRYPSLVIENCGSGGLRMDGASLSLVQLQSTSDQQDLMRYPPIAVSAPTAVPPEQGAVWAYPQPSFSDAEIGFVVGGALLGRVHLSGHLDGMSERQLGLVREGLEVYKRIRGDLAVGSPFWPLGLPKWTDEWLALGVGAPLGGVSYLTVWRRGGPEREVRLPVRHLGGAKDVRVEVLYGGSGATAMWEGDALLVGVAEAPGVVVLGVREGDE